MDDAIACYNASVEATCTQYVTVATAQLAALCNPKILSHSCQFLKDPCRQFVAYHTCEQHGIPRVLVAPLTDFLSLPRVKAGLENELTLPRARKNGPS
jgi:hypothetical protein